MLTRNHIGHFIAYFLVTLVAVTLIEISPFLVIPFPAVVLSIGRVWGEHSMWSWGLFKVDVSGVILVMLIYLLLFLLV